MSILDTMNKKFGGGLLAASEIESFYPKITWLNTGNLGLNKAINYQGKGLPTGSMVESFGPSATGKSVMGLHVLQDTIQQDGFAMLIDVEGGFDTQLAKDIGIDLSKLIVVKPTVEDKEDFRALTVTEVCQRTETFIKEVRKQYGADKLATLVWDSLGYTAQDEDLEGDVPGETRGRQEKRTGRWLKRIRPLVNQTNTLWLVINQVFSNVSSVPTAEPEKAKGGLAVRGNADIRIRWIAQRGKAGKLFDKNDMACGARLHYQIDKNRVGPPWREGFVDWHFDKDGRPSMDYWSGYVNYLVARKAVEKTPGYITVGEKKYRCKQEGSSTHPYYICDTLDTVIENYPELLEV